MQNQEMDNAVLMEDDDTHYCFRCHTKIVGLETYVLHRRQKCNTGLVKQVNLSGGQPFLMGSDGSRTGSMAGIQAFHHNHSQNGTR